MCLRPLEGMEVDVTGAPGRGPGDAAALGPLLKLCSGWQRPGAAVQGQCVLVSPARFEVDVGYHADVIAAFKQAPSRCYGMLLIGPNVSSLCQAVESVPNNVFLWASDMKTRKWSFALEDYRRLSELHPVSNTTLLPLLHYSKRLGSEL